MTKVSVVDGNDAYRVFRKLTGMASNKNTARLFYKFLGSKSDSTVSFEAKWKEIEHTELARVRVEWLLGPNAKVMYEIWKAQNEETY